MRFDLVAFLGGLTVGAAAAALYGATRSPKLGWSGGGAGGGPGGGGSFGGSPSGSGGSSFSGGGGGVSYAPGGTGAYAGPPGPFGGGFMGPSVLETAPSEGEGEIGPIVSVPPIIHDGDGSGIFGGSFFGVNVAPWFWPLNVLPIMPLPLMPRNEEIICKKIPGDPEETMVCQRRYPVRAVAWGPPYGWL